MKWSTSRPPWLRLLALLAVGLVVPVGAAPTPAQAAPTPSLAVYAWGSNEYGTLGTASGSAWVSPPERIPGVFGVAIAASYRQAFALQSDGTVVSWGGNAEGDLGHGTVNTNAPGHADPPGRVVGLSDVVAIASGFTHGLAARRDGTVWAWGGNHASQLGMGPPSAPVPDARPVPGVSEIVAVTAGGSHSVALDRHGYVWTWGDDSFGVLGRAGTGTAPGRVEGVDGAVAIVAYGTQTVALLSNGRAMFWGSGGNFPPREVEGLEGAVAITQGDNHSLALAGDGTVFGWGATGAGQLGERATQVWPARRIAGLDGIRSIAAGRHFSLFATNDGRILSLGMTLDQSPDAYQDSPRTMATLPGLTTVAAGVDTGFALAGPNQAGSTTKPTPTTARISPTTTTRATPTPTTTKQPTPTTSASTPKGTLETPATTPEASEPAPSGSTAPLPTTSSSSAPSPPPEAEQQAQVHRRGSDGSPWPIAALATAALSTVAAVGLRIRRSKRRS